MPHAGMITKGSYHHPTTPPDRHLRPDSDLPQTPDQGTELVEQQGNARLRSWDGRAVLTQTLGIFTDPGT